MKVLDLDMDYFMESIANTPFSVSERLDEEEYGSCVWPQARVKDFLENNLGLSKKHRIPGRIVVGHNESLFFWEELVSKNLLSDPFEVVHVDSHADLGLGCPSSSFLQGRILTLPIETRRRIRDYECSGKIEEISIGDYLLWGIAYRMISKNTYCANPNGDKNDYVWDTLKDFNEIIACDNPVSNYIQLKYNRTMELPRYTSPASYKREYLKHAIKDPEVELMIIPTVEDVHFCGDFNYVVMAQSPNYTPASADFIVQLFRDYIIEI